MWARIEVIPSDRNTVYLPSAWAGACERKIRIHFGGRSALGTLRIQDGQAPLGETSYERPGTLGITRALRDELLMEESPVYRMRVDGSEITIGPVIGLMLGGATQRYNPMHMMKYSDRFGVYSKIGGLIYAFSPKYVNWENKTVYGLYYRQDERSWEYGCFPLPEVIYRRDFHTDPEQVRRLMEWTEGRFFNSFRFTKIQLYDLLRQDRNLRSNLPPTENLTGFEQIKQFIDRHQKVILKPIHLSRGRGICIVEKSGSRYKAVDFRCKRPVTYDLYDEKLLRHFFEVYQDFFDKYLIQKFLPLAKIDGAPFDIRVVMQKRPDREWGSTGVECRVSKNGYLTNISRGGYALHLDQALRSAFHTDTETLSNRIFELCRNVCLALDKSGEHFAELGLDVAVDTERRIWLIEANVFPSFKGFKAIDLDTYFSIRYTPMIYAASLTSFGGSDRPSAR